MVPLPHLMNIMIDGGSCLDAVTSEKDLGVWITSKPGFTLHCDKTSSKAM